ncbi:MAG: homocysteine S-methyltransferase [Algicola sp.]|nr:homocysteine S-methyltransferase [Algicola sp.]
MQNKTAFINRLRDKTPLLLDGGLSNQLEDQGIDLNNALWCAALLKNNPDAIIDAHGYYLDAGADCIITASYQASEQGFMGTGLTAEQANALICQSVKLAETAVEQYLADKAADCTRPLIAASIGPFGACQADGSEYHGNYNVSDETLREFHQDRLKLLDSTNADILACETIPSRQEARVLHDLLLDVNTPAWLCFSCKDGQHANDGTPIEDCVSLFVNHPKVAAIGVNCTGPQYMNELIKRIKKAVPDKAVVVYPNSGEQYHAEDKTWSGTSTPQACGSASATWVEAGAIIIGGCCRMGPEHIRAMKDLL